MLHCKFIFYIEIPHRIILIRYRTQGVSSCFFMTESSGIFTSILSGQILPHLSRGRQLLHPSVQRQSAAGLPAADCGCFMWGEQVGPILVIRLMMMASFARLR
jgi:hypothetical protein